ncbi:MAG: radical SAM protein [Lentisphaerae bacterium]|jgi:MoaA/NifB/PqqE/SkfB family radical SAM enzyme|nr:radical SAM protein [Lentisphaerota bacterium]
MDVHLYVTQACNLRCQHCYYDASQLPVDRSDELTVAELRSVISLLCDKHNADIEMEGGEVFIRRDISELLAALPDEHLKAITVTTNGTMPLEGMTNALRKLRALRISIEGNTEDVHGHLRQSGLQEIVSRGQDLMKAGVPVVARCTLNRTNWEFLEEMIIAFSEWGFSSIQLFEFQAVGRGQNIATEFRLCADAIRSSLELVSGLASENGCPRVRFSLPASRLPIVDEVFGLDQRDGVVAVRRAPSRNSLTIDRNGDLGVCPWLVGSDVVGNLRVADLESILEATKVAGGLVHQCVYCSAVHLYVNSDCVAPPSQLTVP